MTGRVVLRFQTDWTSSITALRIGSKLVSSTAAPYNRVYLNSGAAWQTDKPRLGSEPRNGQLDMFCKARRGDLKGWVVGTRFRANRIVSALNDGGRYLSRPQRHPRNLGHGRAEPAQVPTHRSRCLDLLSIGGDCGDTGITRQCACGLTAVREEKYLVFVSKAGTSSGVGDCHLEIGAQW